MQTAETKPPYSPKEKKGKKKPSEIGKFICWGSVGTHFFPILLRLKAHAMQRKAAEDEWAEEVLAH